MSRQFLLIASRDPYTHRGAERCYALARDLARDGHEVELFLVQNGVLPARDGAGANGLAGLAAAGVRVLADDFSLRERGIDPERIACGIQPTSLDTVVDALEAGARVIWH